MNYKISQAEKKLQDGVPLVISEVALLLGVSREKVFRWVAQGQLQALPGGKPMRVTSASVTEMRTPIAPEKALENRNKDWLRLPGT